MDKNRLVCARTHDHAIVIPKIIHTKKILDYMTMLVIEIPHEM